MSAMAVGVWSFPVLLALIFLRVPIAAAMFGVGVVGSWLVTGRWTPILAQLKFLPYDTFASYSLSIIPLFLLMGQFAARGGLSQALFRAAAAYLGRLRGGLAMAAVGACAGFGAVCGSSLATAATVGQVALPELKARGYGERLATGALAAGGTLGILIPPSVVLVLYALIAEQNIAKLFAAAMVPGVLAMLGYWLTIALVARLSPDQAGAPVAVDAAERRAALLGVWPVAALFVAVIGGIYGGVFTPTEAAAVGAVGAGALAWARGGLGWRALGDALADAAAGTGMIFMIVLGAAVYAAFLASTQAPQAAAAWVAALEVSPWAVLCAILLAYLVFGCVMDSLSMILLTVPIFFPVVMALDLGLAPEEQALWFGVLALVAVEVGLITPPVGLNLFVIRGLSGAPIATVWRGAAPFVLSDLARIALMVAFPGLTLWLVRVLW
jgi:C4-dicarboxylate transporter DctM subunit